MKVPFPVVKREEAYRSHATEQEIQAAIRASKRADVPLSVLRATQREVYPGHVELYERGEIPSKDPIVLERGGKHFIFNGHHRASAAVKRGERSVRARVAHLGPTERIPFHTRSDLLYLEPRAMQATYAPRDVEECCEVVDGIAIMCIEGPLDSKAEYGWWSYFDDYESILCRFKSAIESDDVKAVLMKIDSPGGAAAGLNECVDAMIRAKVATGKPVIGYVDEGCYSAAQAIMCVADETYLPRAGGLGSIGVITSMTDWTEANRSHGIRVEVLTSGDRKADGNPNVPISAKAMAHVQRRIDGLAKLFFGLVKDTRGINAKKLQADTFYGRDAVKVGLADGVMSLEELMSAIASGLDNGTLAQSSYVAQRGATQSSGGKRMSRILKLTAAVQSATKALALAPKANRPAAKAALATAESAMSKELAKVTKDKKTTTTVHESESSSSSESMSSESESSSSSGSASAEAASESASAEAESESAAAIVALVKQITGKTSARSMIGALTAMAANAEAGPKTSARVAKLEARDRKNKIEAIISEGKSARKITPGNEAKARAHAAKYGAKALEAMIDALHPVLDAEYPEPAEDVGGAAITEEQKKIWTKQGYTEKDFPKLSAAVQKELERMSRHQLPVRR